MSRRLIIAITSCLIAVGGLLAGLFSPGPAAAAGHASRQRTGHVWLTVSAGDTHTCGIRRNHTLWCWGWNLFGQLGLGDTTDRHIPTQVGTDTNWAHLDTGDHHTCVTRTDHTLWCWGYNNSGQLGLGDTTDRHTPTQVGTDSDWAQVSAGGEYTCSTRTGHALWCWGDNSAGALGLGDMTDRHTPTQVGTDTDWAHIDASPRSYAHTCGIRRNHTLWCWGFNNSGQLGLGYYGNGPLIPTQVGTGTNWAAVSPGYAHTCATRISHTLWCWGDNGFGQLGLGYVDHGPITPTQVGTDTDWTHIHTGYVFTCATRISHTLWCWGNNFAGQLGLGDTTDRSSPAPVGTRTDWLRLNTGTFDTCGIRANHTLWCWGYNISGELGLGDVRNRWVPRRV